MSEQHAASTGHPETAPVETPSTWALAVLELSRKLAKVMAQEGKNIESPALPTQLGILAAAIEGHSELSATLLAAFDKSGNALAYGESGFNLNREEAALLSVSSIAAEIEQGNLRQEWTSVSSSAFSSEPARPAFARLLSNERGSAGADGAPTGLIVVAGPPGKDSQTLRVLEELSPLLTAAVEDARRRETADRIAKLQSLVQTTFPGVEPQTWDLQTTVETLRELFRADAVSLFLEEQGEIHLSASTDSELGRAHSVVYGREGPQLTSFVFRKGKALRLLDSTNPEEIRHTTGIERVDALHPERDDLGLIKGQFLGVPMRFGGSVMGVIRLSRRQGAFRFSREDEQALQFFADLMGAALCHYWHRLLAESVLESVSECIAVSRRPHRDSSRQQGPRIIIANPGAVRLLGREAKDLEGLPAFEIYAPGEYERLRPELRRARDEALRTGHAALGPVSAKLRRADGRQVPTTVSYRLRANRLLNRPTLYTIGLARDMVESERLAGEHQRLLGLLDDMGIAYFRSTQDGFTPEPTAADCRLTGYAAAELQEVPRDVLHTDPTRRANLYEELRRNDDKLKGVVLQLRRKDGQVFPAEGDVRLLRDPEGNEIGLEGLYRDVSDRMQLQQFLNEDTNQLLSERELFNRLKADAKFHIDYITSLGHQLQTPLASLIETLRNFERRVIGGARLTDRLPYVIGQAVVCSRLVRNLSYMDKILRGEPFNREPVPIAKLAIETKLDFIHILKKRQLDLVVDDDGLSRHITIDGHKEMLRQAFFILIDNACKYSLPNTTIRILGRRWTGRGTGGSGGGALEVSNVGLSLTDEDRKNIFQRGYRTAQARAVIPHGTGLGLWLARRIVEAHGGTIHCTELFDVKSNQKRILFRIVFPEPATSNRRSA